MFNAIMFNAIMFNPTMLNPITQVSAPGEPLL